MPRMRDAYEVQMRMFYRRKYGQQIGAVMDPRECKSY